MRKPVKTIAKRAIKRTVAANPVAICDGKVYTEVQGQKRFDWNRFLDPKRVAKHTETDWKNATDLAGKWTTCACGNQCAAIPRAVIAGWDSRFHNIVLRGEPLDRKLSELGYAFSAAIESRDAGTARGILAQIEMRSTEILIEMSHLKRTP